MRETDPANLGESPGKALYLVLHTGPDSTDLRVQFVLNAWGNLSPAGKRYYEESATRFYSLYSGRDLVLPALERHIEL